jgi:hypothetical protein
MVIKFVDTQPGAVLGNADPHNKYGIGLDLDWTVGDIQGYVGSSPKFTYGWRMHG